MRDLVIALIGGILMALLQVGAYGCNELYKDHLTEKAYSGDAGYVVMHGQYESDGLIVTEDGNEWIYMWENPLPENTAVDIIFRTNDEPKRKWEIITVKEQ